MQTRAWGRVTIRPLVFLWLFYSLQIIPTAALAAASLSPPVIGEVMWAGSSRSTADEWLELWNVNDQSISLEGFRLLGVGGGTAGLSFGADATIAPHQTFLIANYTADDPKSVLLTAPQVATTTISIPNDRLEITLVNSSGETLDRAGNGSAPPAGASGTIKTSMIRRSPTIAGELAEAWLTATSSQGFDAGVFDQGTPGICDACPINETISVSSTVSEVTASTTSTSSLDSSSATTSTTTSFTSSTYVVLSAAASSSETSVSASSTTEALAANPPPLATTLPENRPANTPLPPPFRPRLNEIFPHPATGQEWIEIGNVSSSQLTRMLDWTIEDSHGVILRLTSSTLDTLTSSHPLFWRMFLHSHVLNNDGDVVRLKDLTGNIVDEMNYESAPTEVALVRMPDLEGAWFSSIEATPGAPNVLTAIALPRAVSTDHQPVARPSSVEATSTSPHVVRDALIHTATIVKSSPITSIPWPELMAAATSTAPPVIKRQAPKTPRQITSRAPSKVMTSFSASAPRVRLSGLVGTIPGLLAKNQFVIHTEDGRGLLVKGNGQQTSPPLFTAIHVTGQLITDDSGTSLKMYTRDRWTLQDKPMLVEPRVVDLLEPSTEDVWSLVEVTGTVSETKGTRVGLDTNETHVIAQIRPVIGYRAERLEKGDTLRVRGVIDTRKDPPVLYPRAVEDIAIVKHVEHIQAAAPAPRFPAWTPFGAAGATILATQGFRYLKKRREKQHLEQLLQKAGQTLALVGQEKC